MEKRTFLYLCVWNARLGGYLASPLTFECQTYDHKSESLLLFQKGMQCTLIRGCTNARFSHPLLGTQVAAATEQSSTRFFPKRTHGCAFFSEKKKRKRRIGKTTGFGCQRWSEFFPFTPQLVNFDTRRQAARRVFFFAPDDDAIIARSDIFQKGHFFWTSEGNPKVVCLTKKNTPGQRFCV